MNRRGNWNWKTNLMAVITFFLYLASTAGLVSGLRSGFEMGVAGTEGVAMAPIVASSIAFLIGVSINMLETLVILDFEHTSWVEKAVSVPLFLLDFASLFIALMGHTNIIWLIQNPSDIPGQIVHSIGLGIQVISGVLGAFYAEYSLKRTLQSAGIDVNLHQGHRDQLRRSEPVFTHFGDSPQPLSPTAQTVFKPTNSTKIPFNRRG